MDPKVEQRRPFGAPRASPDLQKQAKTLVKIDVFTMCIKLALGTIFSPLGPPSGGPSDLKGAQSAKNGLHLGHHFEYFFDLFLSWMQDRPGGGPKVPKGASWTHFWGLFEGLLDAFCCTSPAKTQANRWSFPDAGKTSRCGGVASCVLNKTPMFESGRARLGSRPVASPGPAASGPRPAASPGPAASGLAGSTSPCLSGGGPD